MNLKRQSVKWFRFDFEIWGTYYWIRSKFLLTFYAFEANLFLPSNNWFILILNWSDREHYAIFISIPVWILRGDLFSGSNCPTSRTVDHQETLCNSSLKYTSGSSASCSASLRPFCSSWSALSSCFSTTSSIAGTSCWWSWLPMSSCPSLARTDGSVESLDLAMASFCSSHWQPSASTPSLPRSQLFPFLCKK